MFVLFWLLIFTLVLLIFSEPMYVRIEKGDETTITFDLVFLGYSYTKKKKRPSENSEGRKRKISTQSYIKSWLKLHKRVKIKIDTLYLPLHLSPYTNALLCGLVPALSRGVRRYFGSDTTKFSIHIETTLLDCLSFYLRAYGYEKYKEQKESL